MKHSLFNPQAVSDVLLRAWRTGSLLTELAEDIRPSTLDEGYDAQDALLSASGGLRAGWKLGVGSPAQMRAGGLARPLVGQIEKARCHASGTKLQMPSPDPVTVECEIAFVLNRDVPPTPGREPHPEDIRHACVTFEIVRSRFTDRRAVGWPSFSADNVGFEALVVGDALGGGLDLAMLRDVNDTATVLLNEAPKSKALTGDNATDPLRSLAALFGHAAERGITLRTGEIISTGAMCQPFDISGVGHQITATYLGRELTFFL